MLTRVEHEKCFLTSGPDVCFCYVIEEKRLGRRFDEETYVLRKAYMYFLVMFYHSPKLKEISLSLILF